MTPGAKTQVRALSRELRSIALLLWSCFLFFSPTNLYFKAKPQFPRGNFLVSSHLWFNVCWLRLKATVIFLCVVSVSCFMCSYCFPVVSFHFYYLCNHLQLSLKTDLQVICISVYNYKMSVLCFPQSKVCDSNTLCSFSLLKTLALFPGTGKFSTSWPLSILVGKQLYGTWGRTSPLSRSATTATGLVAGMYHKAHWDQLSAKSQQSLSPWIKWQAHLPIY